MTTPLPDHLLAARAAVGGLAAALARHTALTGHAFTLQLHYSHDGAARLASALDRPPAELAPLTRASGVIVTSRELEADALRLRVAPGELLMMLVTFADAARLTATTREVAA